MIKLLVYLIVGLCLVCGVTRSAGADDIPTPSAISKSSDPEIIRQKLIENLTNNSSLSANVKTHLLPPLQDDSVIISTQDIGTAAKTDQDSRNITQGYIIILLFRYRQKPEQILLLYNTLTPENRAQLIAISYIMFPSFISSNYEPLAERAFSDMIAQTNLALSSNNTAASADGGQLSIALGYLHATQNAQTIPAMLKEIRTRVVDPDQRFNIVSYIASHFGASSEPIVRWYFESYAARPFEVKMCLDSLKESEGKETFRRLLQAHLSVFQSASDSPASGVKK